MMSALGKISNHIILNHAGTAAAASARLNFVPSRFVRRQWQPDVPSRFFEPDKHAGYLVEQSNQSFQQKFKHRLDQVRQFPEEMGKLYRHVTLGSGVSDAVQHGDYYFLANFPRDGGIDKWVLTCDANWEEGYSSVSMDACPRGTGTAHFKGCIDTRVPNHPSDNQNQARSGYANCRMPVRTIFGRPQLYDFSMFNMLVIRCRGDGRPYLINLQLSGHYDASWFDMLSFKLYTHGGPYWQVAKIPLSRFVFNYKGRIQNRQRSLKECLHRVKHFGITQAENHTPGPFHLELDYVCMYQDELHREERAWEEYKTSMARIHN